MHHPYHKSDVLLYCCTSHVRHMVLSAGLQQPAPSFILRYVTYLVSGGNWLLILRAQWILRTFIATLGPKSQPVHIQFGFNFAANIYSFIMKRRTLWLEPVCRFTVKQRTLWLEPVRRFTMKRRTLWLEPVRRFTVKQRTLWLEPVCRFTMKRRTLWLEPVRRFTVKQRTLWLEPVRRFNVKRRTLWLEVGNISFWIFGHNFKKLGKWEIEKQF